MFNISLENPEVKEILEEIAQWQANFRHPVAYHYTILT